MTIRYITLWREQVTLWQHPCQPCIFYWTTVNFKSDKIQFKIVIWETESFSRGHFIWNLWDTSKARLINFIWNDHECKILYIWPNMPLKFLQKWPRWLSRTRVRLMIRRSRTQSPPAPATLFRGDWSWNIFCGHFLPSADSRRAIVSFWRKNVHTYWLTA